MYVGYLHQRRRLVLPGLLKWFFGCIFVLLPVRYIYLSVYSFLNYNSNENPSKLKWFFGWYFLSNIPLSVNQQLACHHSLFYPSLLIDSLMWKEIYWENFSTPFTVNRKIFQSNPIDCKEFSDVNMFTSEKSLQSFGLDWKFFLLTVNGVEKFSQYISFHK